MRNLMRTHLTLLNLTLFFLHIASAQPNDWQEVQQIFGRKGTIQEDMIKLTFPRTDLEIHVGDVSIEPALALTTWIAFMNTKEGTMMMGDLVLTESEIHPVMKKLLDNGVEITALHNHLTDESPNVMYMHFSGQGQPTKLATVMHEALAITNTPTGPLPLRAERIDKTDWSTVESILGVTGKRAGGVLQLSIPRAETISERQMEIPPFMGMATAINLQMVEKKTATTGDFVLVAHEVNPVMKALTEHGIAVTALHNHMLNESPRLFFMHFWGYDDPEKLARGLRAALDKTNVLKKK
ncbi:MAG: DUF1259 domain-containing protein [Ignavibacteriae bacterium]|nr:DUF1259 domain-containing protein [Ignavibacteriota bacterium]